MTEPATATPYGHAQPPVPPPYDPRAGRRPGETACKVWGILLLCLGGLGLIGTLLSAAMIYKMPDISGTMVTLPPEARAEFERMFRAIVDDSLARPTFWINMVGEIAVACLAIVAGFFLVIRPRPRGRKLALARAVLVLLLLPIYGIEQIAATDVTFASTEAIMRDSMAKSNAPGREEVLETVNNVNRGVTFGALVLTAAVIVAINGLLAWQMTRPGVRDYLAQAAQGATALPGYDPTLGMLAPPQSAQQPNPPPSQG